MKKFYSLFLIVTFFLGASVFAEDKIMFFKKNTTPGQRNAHALMMGGAIKEDLPEISAAIITFPDGNNVLEEAIRKNEVTRRFSFLDGAEDDPVINWLNQIRPIGKGITNNSALKQINTKTAANNVPGLDAPKEGQLGGQRTPWSISRVGAPQAWAKGLTGKGVVVAVLDTGVQLDHPDLKANIKGGYNAVNPKEAPYDYHGHGTHVAGTIAASNNKIGVVGVAPEAKILAVQVMTPDGSGPPSAIAKGIIWAANNGAQVINMSLGSERSFRAIREAVTYAVSKNVTVVCASGNGGSNRVNYPAALKNTIAVSASDPWDSLAYFSDTGKAITFIAPGVGINSTFIKGGYKESQGTSMASPHVAGLAALAVQAGAKNYEQVLEALKNAAAPLEGLTELQQGSGFINAEMLVK